MRILLVTSIFPPEIGGPATYTYHLAKDLAQQHHIEVVTFAPKDTNIKYPSRVHHLAQSGTTLTRQFSLFRAVYRLLPSFDIVFCQDPLVVGVAPIAAALLRHKPMVVKFVGDIIWEESRNNGYSQTLEDFYSNRKSWSVDKKIKRWLQHFVLAKSKRIVTPSEYLKQFLITNYGIHHDDITVIYNGVVVPYNKKKENSCVALSVGRLVPWKHFDDVIEAAAKIPNLMYYIAGDGPERQKLAALAKEHHIENRVQFLGNLSQEKIRALYNKTDICILNSSYEGLPHVLLEAAAYKNVIIAPALPGILEIFSEDEALLFEPGNKKALLDKMRSACNDAALRRKLAEKAYQTMEENFNWKITLQKTEKILRSISSQ